MDRTTKILAIVFIVIAIVTAIVAFKVISDLVKSWTLTDLPGAAEVTQSTRINAAGTPIPNDLPLQAASGPTPQPWDRTSRITILVMGLDYRDWEAGDTPRTDSMMLLTLDPLSKTAGMLSIPRDMWVNIPRYGYYKINQAYYFGALNKEPGGGPGLAVETVSKFIGVPIQFYAQIDFNAFIKFIDSIGGIPINVPEDITVDPLGKGNTIVMKQGKMTYDGQTALAYARARYTEGGDFDRGKRQMQVVMGIRERIVKLNMLPTLIAKAPELYQQLSEGIKTNLTLDQVIQLSLLAIQIPNESITRAGLGPNEIQFAKSQDGLDILIPVPDRIRIVRDQVFTTGGPAGPAAVNNDAKTLLASESARISLRNGSGVTGMASRTGEYLRGLGYNVVEEGNADTVYESSRMTIYNGKPYTAGELSKQMGIASDRITSNYQPDGKLDIVIIIGRDWARKNPMP